MKSEEQLPAGARLRLPARLKKGASVALIAPSSSATPEKVQKALDNLAALELRVVEGKYLRRQNGYLAGTDAERLQDLHWAFEDDSIDAVWCVRGGYGATRILPDIRYDLIRQNPKLFIGYSDITALHLAIQQRAGLVTFHGPGASADFPPETLQHLLAMVREGSAPYVIEALKTDFPAEEFIPFTLQGGKAKGRLTGGNLCLMAAMTGTAFTPSFKDKIAFIEDVGEQPYRIDRMLTQLLQGTDLSKAAGIALGVFNDCRPKGDGPSFSLNDTLLERLGRLGIPVAYGIPFGHVSYQATLPYGLSVELDADARRLTILEPAVL